MSNYLKTEKPLFQLNDFENMLFGMDNVFKSNFSIKSDSKKEYSGNSCEKNRAKKPRILIVEDDYITRQVHQILIKEYLDCEVILAANGKQALNSFRNCDLILLDLSLPDINGIEVCKEIRKKSKKRLPIVALTVQDNSLVKKECLKAGMNEFVTKPIRSQLLLKVLKNLLPSKKIKLKQNI